MAGRVFVFGIVLFGISLWYLFGFGPLFVLVTILFCFEVLARNSEELAALVYEKQNDNYFYAKLKRCLEVKNGGFWAADAVLGWKNAPNRELEVSMGIPALNLKHNWKSTHDSEGRRITSPLGDNKEQKECLLLLGCSVTYGYGVNDEETFGWLLQERFKDFDVCNYGSNSYSPYQMLLTLERVIEEMSVKVVALGFSEHLPFRSLRLLSRFYGMERWPIPTCISQKKSGSDQYELKGCRPRGYARFPYSRKVRMLAGLEYIFNRVRFPSVQEKQTIRTTEHILLKMKHICQENKVALVVLCLHRAPTYHGFFKKYGFNWCAFDVDPNMGLKLDEYDEESYEWTLFPVDGHPNAKTHGVYAKMLGDAIDKVMKGERVSCDLATVEAKNMSERTREGDNFYPLF